MKVSDNATHVGGQRRRLPLEGRRAVVWCTESRVAAGQLMNGGHKVHAIEALQKVNRVAVFIPAVPIIGVAGKNQAVMVFMSVPLPGADKRLTAS